MTTPATCNGVAGQVLVSHSRPIRVIRWSEQPLIAQHTLNLRDQHGIMSTQQPLTNTPWFFCMEWVDKQMDTQHNFNQVDHFMRLTRGMLLLRQHPTWSQRLEPLKTRGSISSPGEHNWPTHLNGLPWIQMAIREEDPSISHHLLSSQISTRQFTSSTRLLMRSFASCTQQVDKLILPKFILEVYHREDTPQLLLWLDRTSSW